MISEDRREPSDSSNVTDRVHLLATRIAFSCLDRQPLARPPGEKCQSLILATLLLPLPFSCSSRLLGGLKFLDHSLTESLHLFHLWTELQKQEIDSSAFKLFDLLLHLRRSSHQPWTKAAVRH